MAAIAESQLTLGELLVGIFTPNAFAAPALRAYDELVRAFLCGTQPLRMAQVLDCLLVHPDAQPPSYAHGQSFSLTTPYDTLAYAQPVLTSWAMQAVSTRAKDRRSHTPLSRAQGSPAPVATLPKEGRKEVNHIQRPPRPLPPVPEPYTSVIAASSDPEGSSTPNGIVLRVDLIHEQRAVSAIVSSLRASDSGGSARIWQGDMMEPPNEIVALKVFRPTTSPDAAQELIDREIYAWRRLHHPRLLPFLGTSVWDAQTVLVSPYMDNGNMLQYLQVMLAEGFEIDRLKLVVQVAEGLKYLHTEAFMVHGDIKCQNVLITDTGDAILADFGLSTLIEKFDSDATTGTAIRDRCTLRFSAPELLGSLPDDDRGRMRSKTVKTDIYAFGMLVLQAFTGTDPWGGLSELKVLEYTLSGLNPPHPKAAAASRGLDERIWMICRWCWQFQPIDRPPIDLVYHALALHHRDTCSPTDLVDWLASEKFRQHHWSWPVLNGLLALIRTPELLEALSVESLTNILGAIVTIESRDVDELRVALKRFASILRIYDRCALHILSADHIPALWTRLYSLSFNGAPEEVLDVMCILGWALVRFRSDLPDTSGVCIKAAKQQESVEAAVTLFLNYGLDDIFLSLDRLGGLELVSRCDQSLHTLLRITALLSPSRWISLTANIPASATQLPASRVSVYLRHLEELGHTSLDAISEEDSVSDILSPDPVVDSE